MCYDYIPDKMADATEPQAKKMRTEEGGEVTEIHQEEAVTIQENNLNGKQSDQEKNQEGGQNEQQNEKNQEKFVEDQGEKKCTVTGICLSTVQSDKFNLLLPVIYPLNKSKYKSLIMGLNLNYVTREVKPVIGIIDQKYKGIILSPKAWDKLVSCFGKIDEFFRNDNAKKCDELIDKPVTYDEFIVTYNYMNFNFSKSKVVRIEEIDSSVFLDKQKSVFPSVIMQSNTFASLPKIVPIVSEYFTFLYSMIPCVNECLSTLINYAKLDVNTFRVNDILKNCNAEVAKYMATCSLCKPECMREIENIIENIRNGDFVEQAHYKRVINEMMMYHSDFLIYNVFN